MMVCQQGAGTGRKASAVGTRSRLIAAVAIWAFLAGVAGVHLGSGVLGKCNSAAAEAALSRATAAVESAAQALAVLKAAQREPSLGAQLQPLAQQGELQGGPQQGEQQQQRQRQQQAAVDPSWPHLRGLPLDRITQLIQAPAGLHGVQKKGGLPADFMFLMAHLTDTNPQSREEGIPRTFGPAAFQWFARAYSFNRTHQTNAELQSPVPTCHFWADHKYKILYVRNFKTAGTSITITLGQKELPMYCTYQPDNCAKKCQGKQVCLENISDPERLKQLFAQYTVFAFVRNPWARALSSWHHVHKYGLQEQCHDTFEKFAEVPSRYGAKCLAELNCCKRRPGWLLEHIEPQSTCLFDAAGQPAVDFVGRVEHLDEDMQELVRFVNSRLDPGVEPLRVGKLPHWQLARADMATKQGELWRYYAGLYFNSTTAMSDVRSYFHRDFDLLQIPGKDPRQKPG